MTDCNICAEKFNKSTRNPIQCYCGFICCKACLKTYLLSIDDAVCMSESCNLAFDKKFLTENFDKKFLTTTYKLHRETVLFNRELALMPLAQIELEKIKAIEMSECELRTIKFKINTINSYIVEITNIINDIESKNPKNICLYKNCNLSLTSSLYCYNCQKNIADLYYKLNTEYVNSIINIDTAYDLQKIYVLQDTQFTDESHNTEIDKVFNIELLKHIFIYILNSIKRNQFTTIKNYLNNDYRDVNVKLSNLYSGSTTTEFIRECPNNDCRGFLSTELKCKLCNCLTCGDCREIITNKHECNPETVETIKLLATETKLCPGCSVPIYKINGCDNMYCIQCKVHFRWTTLKIKKHIDRHNPEYTADMLRISGTDFIPRDRNDILCGRDLDHYFRKALINKCTFGSSITITNDPQASYELRDASNFVNGKLLFYQNAIDIKNIMDHILDIRQKTTRTYANNDADPNRQLRLDYLQNKIDKTTFKIHIQRNEKKQQKNDSMYQILSLYASCITDLVYKLDTDVKLFDKFIEEVHGLRELTNNELKINAKYWNTVIYVIDKSFQFHNVRHTNYNE